MILLMHNATFVYECMYEWAVYRIGLQDLLNLQGFWCEAGWQNATLFLYAHLCPVPSPISKLCFRRKVPNKRIVLTLAHPGGKLLWPINHHQKASSLNVGQSMSDKGTHPFSNTQSIALKRRLFLYCQLVKHIASLSSSYQGCLYIPG